MPACNFDLNGEVKIARIILFVSESWSSDDKRVPPKRECRRLVWSKRLWIGVSGLDVGRRSVRPALDLLFRQERKEALDLVDPG
jgi:hypothetical protein